MCSVESSDQIWSRYGEELGWKQNRKDLLHIYNHSTFSLLERLSQIRVQAGSYFPLPFLARFKTQVRKIENATSNSPSQRIRFFPVGLRRVGCERDFYCPLGRMRDPKILTTAHDDD